MAAGSRKKWLWLAIAALVVAGSLTWLLGTREAVPAYLIEPAVRGDLTVIVTATGSVQPVNKVEVSSELSGTIRKVLVDFNSLVVPGQVLAELDTEKLAATVENSRAKLNAAVAQVALAEATVAETQRVYERRTTLAAKQFATEHELQAAQAAFRRALASLESAKAEVGVARADLKVNETNITKATIRSPIRGIVLTRNVDPGQTVAVSLQAPILFTIAEDLRQMELQVDVDEADVGRLGIGQKATFSVDAYPDRKFPAQIRDVRFGSEIVQGVVTYKAVLMIDNAELLLRPGMTATAEIVVQEVQNALLVPNAALRFAPAPSEAKQQSDGFLRRLLPRMPAFRPASRQEETGANRTVWLLRSGEPHAVAVVTGATDGRYTEVLEGKISQDDPVIVDTNAMNR